MSVDWDALAIAVLRKMHGDGFSATLISRVIPGSTRNSIMGKLFRLGLCGTGPETRVTATRKPRPPAEYIRRVRKARAPVLAAPIEPDPDPEQSDCAIPFMEAKPYHCRYPIGDTSNLETFRFCGGEALTEAGSPYCARHTRLCWTPRRSLYEHRAPAGRLAVMRSWK